MTKRVTRLVLTSCIALAACRDGVAPFVQVPIDRDTGSIRQLTRSTNLDANPTWGSNSDTVYYTAAAFVDYPNLVHTMLRVALDSGPASRVAADAQPGNSGSLLLPVLSPNHQSIAYVHIDFIWPPAICHPRVPPAPVCETGEPLLEKGTLRIRPAGARAAAISDPGVAIPFQGVDPLRQTGGDNDNPIYTQRAFPFQREFRNSGATLFRASWERNGQRIVFSDGLMLRVWNGTDAQSTVVPNTADGVSPAWNPAGNEIAFTRLVRGDSTLTVCSCYEPPDPPTKGPTPVHNRWSYTVARSVITLVNADGTGLTEISEGTEPAWSPDGSTIYFVRDDQIYRMPRAGGNATPLANTTRGSAPAVSPDGKWLAFARRSDTNSKDTDIWVLRLSSQ